jgi:hypothetical protein
MVAEPRDDSFVITGPAGVPFENTEPGAGQGAGRGRNASLCIKA